MPDSWKYAQVLRFPQSDLCECGHDEAHHNNRHGFCYECLMGGAGEPDIADDPSGDVYRMMLHGSRVRESCDRFRRWPAKRVKAFWKIANIGIALRYGLEQTILDDFSPDPGNWDMWTRGNWRYDPI